jgi:peroxiredoxin
MAAPPAPGEPAPDFDLPSAGGREIRLADFRGKRNVVLLFFPGAFTPVCTKEVCEFRDRYREIAHLDAEILAISTDDLDTLERFRKQYHLPIRLLADYSKAVSRRYGALGLFGRPKRATFVVDKAGIVRFSKVQFPIFRPSPQEVANVLLKLRKEAEEGAP